MQASCSRDEGLQTHGEGHADPVISRSDIETQEELTAYLEQEFGEVQSLPSLFSGSRDRNTGDFRYRLPDGRELAIPGMYTPATGMIVDPEFDLESYLNQID